MDKNGYISDFYKNNERRSPSNIVNQPQEKEQDSHEVHFGGVEFPTPADDKANLKKAASKKFF